MRIEVLTAVKKHAVSIFSPEDGVSMFLRNVGIHLRVHTAATQKTNIDN
jgi:hypothetical protein